MVFGALLSAQDGVHIESSWDRAYEGYLALSASTHHYRMLKKWASVDRKGVYGLMCHVQRNRLWRTYLEMRSTLKQQM